MLSASQADEPRDSTYFLQRHARHKEKVVTTVSSSSSSYCTLAAGRKHVPRINRPAPDRRALSFLKRLSATAATPIHCCLCPLLLIWSLSRRRARHATEASLSCLTHMATRHRHRSLATKPTRYAHVPTQIVCCSSHTARNVQLQPRNYYHLVHSPRKSTGHPFSLPRL